MPKYFAIRLNYSQVGKESYYAQIYAGIMCQGLPLTVQYEMWSVHTCGHGGGDCPIVCCWLSLPSLPFFFCISQPL